MKNKLYTLIFLVSFFNCYSQTKKTGITPTVVTPPTCETYVYVDNDLDGFGAGTRVCLDTLPDGIPYSSIGTDCNDNNAAINPNTIWYVDADSDSFGSATATPFVGCYPTPQAGYVLNNLDCNDANAAINPNTKWYRDSDGDTFGNVNVFLVQCNQPAGYVLNNTDCNDSNNLIKGPTTWYQDSDNDGFGNPAVATVACSAPVGYVADNLDGCPTVSGPIQGCIVPNPTSTYSTRNYIITTMPKVPVTNIQSISSAKDVMVSITYYDDLGKPNQKIATQQSASGFNIVTHIEYDPYNRQVKEYLPYKAGTQGIAFETSALSSTLSYPDYTGQNPYSEKLFDTSPLNEVLKQAAPGTTNDWGMGGNHEIKFDNLTNSATEVKLYAGVASWNAATGLYDFTMTQTGAYNYAANQLIKTVVKDENWTSGNNNTTEEFKNKLGQVVLKRTYDNSVAHDTYYVYDQYGNLTYVIPPLVTNFSSQTQLDGLCYQYRYDLRNRLVEKKLPGKQKEFMVYDKLDRLVAAGPTSTPFPSSTGNGWMITKYDAFNRPILTAWQSATVSAATRVTLQTAYNNATILNETKNTATTDSAPVNNIACRYSNVAMPTSGYDMLTVNYYDDYNFSFAPTTIPTTVESQSVYYNATVKPKGLATGTWVRVLDTNNTSTSAEKAYTLYDYKARPIRNYKYNYLGGFVQVDENLEQITGRTNYTVTTHSRASLVSGIVTIKDEFTYSNQDRLLIQTQQINVLPKQLIVSNTYNELGQLTSKRVGGTNVTGTAGLQKVDFSYNIRNWLTEINKIASLTQGSDPADLFAFKINYNDVQDEIGYTGTKLYNGNISETYWKTSDNIVRKYGYFYDNLNRLKNAVYQKPIIGGNGTVPNFYNENVTYDKNGNILTLYRNGGSDSVVPVVNIDNLVYSYTPDTNQLLKVDDSTNNPNGFLDVNSATDYTFDANGNMTTDSNKGITAAIVYNQLNLPLGITFATGNIKYVYNAAGQKVKKVVTITAPISTNTTDYVDGFQYLNNVLQYFPTTEGYVSYATGSYKYIFQYKDYLGNVRVSYTDNGNGTLGIVEESNYYPFGLKQTGYNQNGMISFAEGQKYKFSGKEMQNELELNMYDYGARLYDPARAGWSNIDPLAEVSRRWSPYNYVYNNPMRFTDPDGMSPQDNVIVDNRPISRFEHWSDEVRGVKRDEKGVAVQDLAISLTMRQTAKLYFDNKDVSSLTEAKKQEIFKTDAIQTIGVLLYEFATGTGKEDRDFYYNVHPFATQFIDARMNEIIYSYNEGVAKLGYKNASECSEFVKIDLPFSPGLNPVSWGGAINHIMSSDAVGQFVGGATGTIQVSRGIINGTIDNATSRNSLLLHLGDNYKRKDGNRILSTIFQHIHFSGEVIYK